MSDYVYSTSSDMPGGKVNPGRLRSEILASSIETELLDVATGGGSAAWGVVTGGTLTITFVSDLSSAEKTVLDGDTTDPAGGLLAAHDNEPTPVDTFWQGIVGTNEQFAKISDALAAGCTSIYVRNGVYVETSDVVLPAGGGVLITGESPGGVTIVLVGAAQMKIDGCGGVQEYTGTVSLTHGSATITGSGTSFTNIAAEWWIKVQGIYLHVKSVESDTSLTLKAPYEGKSLSGQSFIAHSMCAGFLLQNLMLYKSSGYTGIPLYMRSVNHGIVRDCLISGAASSSFGIHMLGCTECFIISSVVQRCGSHGVKIEKSSMAQVSACAFKQNGGNGLEFDDSQNCVVDQTISVMNSGAGVNVTNGTEQITLTDSIFRVNNGKGVNTDTGTGVCIMDSCVIGENGGDGLDFDGSENLISACAILNNGGVGIQGGLAGAISGCHVNGNSGIGIALGNDARCTVTGCRVIDNGGVGIDMGASGGDCSIQGGVVSGNGAEGIKCAGNRCAIQGVRVMDNTNEGIEIVAGATNCIVMGNIATGNGTAQITDNGTGTVVEHNVTA